jgi:UDP-N-acetylmuramoyl-tripeptide--D-alanyl-D-alanine ligase
MASILAFYALAVLSMTLSALSQTALWQRKEYRVDRVRSYLLSPEKSVQDIVIWALAFVCAVMAFIFSFFAYTAVLVLLVGYGVRAVQRGVSRPVFTMRAIAVLVNTGVLALLAFSSTANIVWVSLVAVFMPLVVAITVGIIALPAMIQKKSVMNRAITYRKNLKNLQVIGITGSVGKTSTKTYAMHILQGNDKNIVATHEHRNSPYVVAQDMMMHVSEKTNTYIAELGAYRKGEIAELCEIVQPTIGVITAITNQHAGLFGSVEELAQTKWELADAIPDTGTLVLNKGNEIIRSKSAGVHKKIIWYSLKNSADVIFEQILIQQDHVEVVLMISGESYPVRIPVVSEGQLSSVLAACAVAYAVGVSASDIAKRLETLPVLPKTMELL